MSYIILLIHEDQTTEDKLQRLDSTVHLFYIRSTGKATQQCDHFNRYPIFMFRLTLYAECCFVNVM